MIRKWYPAVLAAAATLGLGGQLAAAPEAAAQESAASILNRMRSTCRQERDAAIALILPYFSHAGAEAMADMPLGSLDRVADREAALRLEQSSRDAAREAPMLAAQSLYPACVYAALARELPGRNETTAPPRNQIERAGPPQNQIEPAGPLQNQIEPAGPLQNQIEPAGPLQNQIESSNPPGFGESSVFHDAQGRLCVSAESLAREEHPVYWGYRVRFTNSCDRRFTIRLETNPHPAKQPEVKTLGITAALTGEATTATSSGCLQRRSGAAQLTDCVDGYAWWWLQSGDQESQRQAVEPHPVN